MVRQKFNGITGFNFILLPNVRQRLENARTADIFLAMYICNYFFVYFKYNLALLKKNAHFVSFLFV
jgi:hypothetical protein